MQAIIDRIEGKIAVLEIEGELFIEIPKKFLPKGVKDGDVLKITFEIDEIAKKQKIEKIKKLQKKLQRQR